MITAVIKMEFGKIRIKDIDLVKEFTLKAKYWTAKNRPNHIIGFQKDGAYYHDISGKILLHGENTVYFLNQKDDYTVRCEAPGTCYSVHFTTYLPIDCESFAFPVNSCEEIFRLWKNAEKQFLRQGETDAALLEAVYRMLDLLQKMLDKKYAPKNNRILRAKAYMDQHFREEDCLAVAQAMAEVSPRRFNDVFRQTFGCTPGKYIARRKIDYAAELLKTNLFPVSEVAEMCGFADVYYFSKAFKNETGLPPSKYREH